MLRLGMLADDRDTGKSPSLDFATALVKRRGQLPRAGRTQTNWKSSYLVRLKNSTSATPVLPPTPVTKAV